jgi:hypothetical protein
MNLDLAFAAGALADTLTRENAALAAMDLPGANALLAQKLRTVEAFALAHQKAAPARPGDLDRPTVERLRTLAAENKRLLDRAMAVQGRVIELVASAVPKSFEKSPRYTAAGDIAPARRMPPLTLSSRA